MNLYVPLLLKYMTLKNGPDMLSIRLLKLLHESI